ncbi:MAG: cyclodeaminase/cyclohydrolase family protein, partial [Gemmatimonadota bacterium]
KQQRSLGVSDSELIWIAIKSMGLDELKPFVPAERIIEYRLRDPHEKRLVDLSVTSFADETSSESPAPGGGSVAALIGALGASLGAMVANLSSHKKGWDARWEEFSEWAARGQALKAELLGLVDEDTRAFNRVLAAMGMPKGSDAEKAARSAAIEEANRGAIEVPFRVMKAAHASFDVIKAMAEQGLKASASDAGVAALCARTAVLGAWLNVRTNVASLKNKRPVEALLYEGGNLAADAERLEVETRRIAEKRFEE